MKNLKYSFIIACFLASFFKLSASESTDKTLPQVQDQACDLLSQLNPKENQEALYIQILTLLSRSGNIERVLNKKGENILHLAAIQKNEHLINFILSQKCVSPALRTKKGKQAHELVKGKISKKIKKSLTVFEELTMTLLEPGKEGDFLIHMERGANPNYKFKGKQTAFHICAEKNLMAHIKILCERRAIPTFKNAQGKRPFELAQAEDGTTCEFLTQLYHESSVQIFEAVASRDYSEVLRFLDFDVDPDYRHLEDGITPLTLAALNGFDELVVVLVERGARLDLTDGKGNTALELALSNEHHKTVDHIERYLREQEHNPYFRCASYGLPLGTHHRTGASVLHAQGLKGDGIMVAVLDSTGADFRKPQLRGQDHPGGGYLGGDSSAPMIFDPVSLGLPSVYEETGHGHSQACTIAGNRHGDTVGTAPRAKIVPFNFQSKSCEHFRHVVETTGARVINISLQDFRFDGIWREGLCNLIKEDVLVVIIAANHKKGNPATLLADGWPAEHKAILDSILVTVAVNPRGHLTRHSRKCTAKLARHCVAVPSHNPTSPTASLVSGGVALLRQAFPDVSAKEIKEALIRTAEPIEGSSPDTTGSGLVRFDRAFESIRKVMIFRELGLLLKGDSSNSERQYLYVQNKTAREIKVEIEGYTRNGGSYVLKPRVSSNNFHFDYTKFGGKAERTIKVLDNRTDEVLFEGRVQLIDGGNSLLTLDGEAEDGTGLVLNTIALRVD